MYIYIYLYKKKFKCLNEVVEITFKNRLPVKKTSKNFVRPLL